MNTPEHIKNITRYDTTSADFSGWRVAVTRGGRNFVQYFSDRQYGSKEASFQAAKEKREEIYTAFSRAKIAGKTNIRDIKNAYGDILEEMRLKLQEELSSRQESSSIYGI